MAQKLINFIREQFDIYVCEQDISLLKSVINAVSFFGILIAAAALFPAAVLLDLRERIKKGVNTWLLYRKTEKA